MGKINQAMGSGNMADMKEIWKADERWLRILFGEPYEAKFQSGGVHVYDGNGDALQSGMPHTCKYLFYGLKS